MDITVVSILGMILGIMVVTGEAGTILGIMAVAGAGVGADLGMAMAGVAGTAAVGMPEAGMADIITDTTVVHIIIIPDVLGQVTDPVGQVMVRGVVHTVMPAVDQASTVPVLAMAAEVHLPEV